MKNIAIKDLIKIAAIIYFVIIAFSFLSIANKFLVNQEIDIKIKHETLLGNLLYQYNLDLLDCINSIEDNPELTEEKCVEEMNNSNLAEKIREWGGEQYLKQYPDQ